MKLKDLKKLKSIRIMTDNGYERWYRVNDVYWKKTNSEMMLKEGALFLYIKHIRKIKKGRISVKR